MSKLRVEYSSRNSGGRWWLKDKDWHELEKAGWKVDWFKDQPEYADKGGRWLDSLARSATREGLTLEQAANEWEAVTGLSSTDAGCPCCGQPHSFTEYEGNKYIRSGPDVSHSCAW